ncbi:DNA-processing protein DprA [Svornostia abyssi]|uniref:DNA-processing protein DprA n=1 Tax=Svornostia abyssi TaxID=2898438 RepID=A0ABY5PBU5_9ACTN|nr:DNA-processing protein DprA [Parviterribacteraceae bacterium J379]
MTACDDCLRRAWLIAMLSGNLERARRRGGVLALDDDALIDALGGTERHELAKQYAGFDPRRGRAIVQAAGLTSRCAHSDGYPSRLSDLEDAPAALFVAGRPGALDALASDDDLAPAVAIVGARRCAGEGEEVARALGQGLAAAGVCVVSGLALGIDSAAHHGALAASRPQPAGPIAPTIAVLAGGADVIYPPSGRGLYTQIVETGCVVSELPPGVRPRKWSFPARNRIIAGLAGMTVVVQARERSGSLITADLAMQLGRPVGAVPGPVTRGLSQGSNALLHDGAHVIRDARDVLEALLPGYRHEPARGPNLAPDLAAVLTAVENGHATPGEVAGAHGGDPAAALTALTRLELLGLVRRDPAGRYARAADLGPALL